MSTTPQFGILTGMCKMIEQTMEQAITAINIQFFQQGPLSDHSMLRSGLNQQ